MFPPVLPAAYALSLLASGALANRLAPRDALVDACARIEAEVSSASTVLYPGTADYNDSISHFSNSSSQVSACSVTPGSTADVSQVIKIVGDLQVPFAVKGSGHAYNPNFSSTPGVLIVTSNFKDIVYDADADTATLGVGSTWIEVDLALEQYGVAVPSGRCPGVGVGGLITGGGYSFLTSEHGLAIDSVTGYELVMPNGTATNVTESSNPELFWALKGTGTNFGVVTRVTMKAYQQGLVWGGVFQISYEYSDEIAQAWANFDANANDPKAALVMDHQLRVDGANSTANFLIFYNAPKQPAGIFDKILAIPRLTEDIGTRNISGILLAEGPDTRTRYNFEQVPNNKFPLELLEAFFAEQELLAAELANTSIVHTTVLLETFTRDLLTHASPVPGFTTPSAWPPTRAFASFPNGFWTVHTDPADDVVVANAVQASARRLRVKAEQLGIEHVVPDGAEVVLYPNYAHWNNTPEDMYGSALPRLREIYDEYDPEGVMKMTGGFKLY